MKSAITLAGVGMKSFPNKRKLYGACKRSIKFSRLVSTEKFELTTTDMVKRPLERQAAPDCSGADSTLNG